MRGARLVWAAFLYTVIVGVTLAFVPTGTSEEMGASSDGATYTTVSHMALFESDGYGALVVLAVPIVVTGLALAARRSERARGVWLATGWAMVVGCFLGAMSVGVFYLVVPVLLLAAAHLAKAPHLVPLTA